MNYQEFKDWQDKNRDKFIYTACFLLVFLSGFGAGRYDKVHNSSKYKTQNNYSKITENQQKQQGIVAGDNLTTKTEGAAQNATTVKATLVEECKIKGNISAGGKKIYHIPGGASYKAVKPEMCFKTQEEAILAGFVKSGR